MGLQRGPDSDQSPGAGRQGNLACGRAARAL